ncbi:MAG TPA: hypothetical protein VFU69_15520, partial [Ktedonobacterales bacterium]|nr:hypothetical protein [Ktedonobacterales bacterium]
DIIGQFEQGTFSDMSFEMKVAQARTSPGQEWQAKAANLEAALALVRKLGLSSATHDLNQMFLRMGLPAIPKR